MSTNAPTNAPTAVNYADKARNLYKGHTGQGPTGEALRQLIRKGRAVVRRESMRWEENRQFYKGNQWVRPNLGTQHLSQLNSGVSVPSGRPGSNSYNHFRKNINSRVSLLTKERPAFEVIPEDNDQDSLDAARFAEKFLTARWGQEGWDIKEIVTELAKNGDIDGLAWLCVEWDPDAAQSTDQPLAVRMDGTPVTEREEYEALKAMDPQMTSLWRVVRSPRPIGDVTWRVVLPASLSVDPFAVKDFKDAKWIAETRVRPRAEIERRMGMTFKDAIKESNETLSENAGNFQYQDLAVGDGGGRHTISEMDGVVVHYFTAKPCADFPKGARVEILDRAPAKPLRAEEWQDDLPYFCYIPCPDEGHFLSSTGVADDLKPVQRDYNQTRVYLKKWLFKVANAPLMLPIGSMRGNDFYNEDGYVEVHMATGQPVQTTTPSEPTAVFMNDLQSMKADMADLSGVSDIARGFNSPGGPEAAVGISQQIQQTEHNLSETEGHLVAGIEWGCSRSLRLVEKHYDVARTVQGMGADDAGEFKAFSGQMIRGARRMRVTSPLMPKSKAARMASIQNLAPLFGPDALQPYLSQLIDGDTTELQRDVDESRKHQRAEIRDLLGMVTNEQAQAVYENFEADKKAFAEAFNMAARQAAQMPPMVDPETGMPGPPPDPMQILGQQGIVPPNLTTSLQNAGLEVPTVEGEDDIHTIELKACNTFRLSDAYKRTAPMFKQLLREHMAAHKAGTRQMMQAMAQQSPMGQQQGSNPAEKGTPSPPKQHPGGPT